MKTFVISGATGLIGRSLVNSLYAQDVRIVLPVRNISKANKLFQDKKDIEIIYHDFSKTEPLTIDEPVDYVIHAACPTSSQFMVEKPVETLDTILNGTRTMLELAKNKNVKGMVFLSSMEVYGTITDDTIAVTEDSQYYINPLNTRSSYPMAKRMAETMCYSYFKEYDVPVCIARLAQTFGPGVNLDTDNRVFAQFARCVKDGRNIELATMGGTKRMYLHVFDAISAIDCLLSEGIRGVAYNVANEKSYISIKDMAEYVKSTYNPDIKVIIKLKHHHAYLEETHLRLSIEKIKELGWAPQYGLKDMFDAMILS